jgi:hypothetical protein
MNGRWPPKAVKALFCFTHKIVKHLFLTHPLYVAFSPAQANCLSLGEINSSQLVYIWYWYIVMVLVYGIDIGIADMQKVENLPPVDFQVKMYAKGQNQRALTRMYKLPHIF